MLDCFLAFKVNWGSFWMKNQFVVHKEVFQIYLRAIMQRLDWGMPHVSHRFITKFDVRLKGWWLALRRRPHVHLLIAGKIFLLEKIVSTLHFMLLEQFHKFVHILDHVRGVFLSFSYIRWLSTLWYNIMVFVEFDLGNLVDWLPKVVSVLFFIQVIKKRLKCQWHIASFLFLGIILLFMILILDCFISDLAHYFPKLHQFFIVSAQLLELVNGNMTRAICIKNFKYSFNLFLFEN